MPIGSVVTLARREDHVALCRNMPRLMERISLLAHDHPPTPEITPEQAIAQLARETQAALNKILGSGTVFSVAMHHHEAPEMRRKFSILCR